MHWTQTRLSTKPLTPTLSPEYEGEGVRRPSVLAALVFLISLTTLQASAGPQPSVSSMSVRGLQSGGTTTIVINGSDLLPDPRIVCLAPITKQEVKPGATATRVEMDVTLDAKAEPGIYNAWVVTNNGPAERQIITIDSLPQKPFPPAQPEPPPFALPIALHGNFNGSRPVETTFTGKGGQPVTIEVEAQRLGGREQPVVHLLDPTGQEIGLALPSIKLRGDVRLTTTLPSDGTYRVRVHDLQYGGNGPLRLKIGSWQFADLAFPPAVERGKAGRVSLIGDSAAPQQADLLNGLWSAIAPRWPDASKASGPRPAVFVSPIAESVEAEPGGTLAAPQQLGARVPFAVSGKLSKAGEQDAYRLPVTPDASLRFEVFADRYGSPLDAVIELRNAKGEKITENDDTETADPRVDYKVPAGTDAVIVVVRDTLNRGGDDFLYRLSVTTTPETNPVLAQPPSLLPPDFDLIVDDDSAAPIAGGTNLLKVSARRRGYDGPIRLNLENAPGWVALGRNEIAAGSDATLVTLQNNTSAGPGTPPAPPAVIAVVGEGSGPAGPITRIAAADVHPVGDLQPWLRSELLLASAGAPDVPFSIDFGAIPDDRKLIPGGKISLPAKCVRAVGFDGNVRLTLLVSHATPVDRNNGRPDMNRLLRSEQPRVDIPADGNARNTFDAKVNAEKALADAKKALDAVPATDVAAKTAAEAKVKQTTDALTAADAAATAASAAAKNDIEVPVVIPNDLPYAPGGYDFSFRADLLGRDNRTVLATRFTPVKRLPVVSPVTIALASPPRVEVRLTKDGASAKWSGTIERKEGATGEVAVFLEGLPSGIGQPRINVPGDKTTYELELKLPATATPVEIKSMKAFAEIKGTNGQPVRGVPVGVELNVRPREDEKNEPAK